MVEPALQILTGPMISKIMTDNLSALYDVIRHAYFAHYNQQTVLPPSSFMRFPDKPAARIIALPAAIIQAKQKLAGIKWIASHPDNIYQGLARASALIILNDYETGYPYACLEGAKISAIRTVLSGIWATQALHRGHKSIAHLGIVGTGNIAEKYYTSLLKLGWEIGEISLFDKDRQLVERA